MNQNSNLLQVQFYKTPPMKCPYLPNRNEQLVFTHLNRGNPDQVHSLMANAGFRRSQGIVYRPDCVNCSECVPVRIRTRDYQPNRNQKRVLQRNSQLRSLVRPAIATYEHFNLFICYQKARHGDGNMAQMDFEEYRAMIEESPVETLVIEYREIDGSLFAVALTDRVYDGLSMVYSFFQPNGKSRSPGTWIILEHVSRAKRHRLPFVYLGFLIQGCSKMSYKSRFKPLEALRDSDWEEIETSI